MAIQIILTSIAGGILLTLGALHFVYALLDIKTPRRLAPSDDSVRLGMLKSTLRITRGRTSMWDAWLGFNLSHGLGAMILGAAAVFVPVISAPTYETAVLLTLTVLSVTYLAIAIRFWFYIPATGIALSTLLLLAALALHLAKPH